MRVTAAEAVELLSLMRDGTRTRHDPINLFLGFCLRNIGWSHGQLLQDLWVAFELNSRRNGFFVEFGAADGVHYSNTYGLETELGWNGILAEPARSWRPAIHNNRTCAVDTRCVWSGSGERLVFNEPVIALHATIDSFSQGDHLSDTRKEGERYEVETVSLNDLLAHWRAPRRIDYLSVDTEGSELEILRAFDFDAYDVRLITVEHNRDAAKRQGLHDLLTGRGYRRKYETLSAFDDWYVKTY